ncbi:hypothetical protein [Photobacterium kishitanii]|uniref:SAM-dependent methyltransferase n=1 Tax=Photobacterium kishitanii TaxID=318456 RepID=A0A2T3KLI3_9GAMM|nr:hypothetical protein [Photobacterium kishitanii]PSV00519.1 hypothetical protein C9J27_05135 [Photobacterium kishitanii]
MLDSKDFNTDKRREIVETALNVYNIEGAQEFLETLSQGNIAPSFPSVGALDDLSVFGQKPFDPSALLSLSVFHDIVASTNLMFGYISKSGAAYLANKFKGKTFIDPIAGRGWFAKALREQGVTVYAGDHDVDTLCPVTEVENSDCVDLVNKYKDEADILLLSWAHFKDTSDLDSALEWGAGKPIIVYGELGASCNSQEFCEIFITDELISDFPDLNCKRLKRVTMRLGHI